MNDQIEQEAGASDAFYCPACGRRYPAAGLCDTEHAPTELQEVAAAVEPPADAGAVPGVAAVVQGEPEPAAAEPEPEPAAAEPAAAEDTRSRLAAAVAAAKAHLDDVTTLLAGL